MSHNPLDDRRDALENAFFARQEAAMRERMREAEQTRTRRESLRAASGLTDEAALDRLDALGVSPETLAALSLVPLVAVAWADGSLDDRERAAVLSGAAEAGVEPGGPAHGLLDRWLSAPPPPELTETWAAYVRALDADTRASLRASVTGRARRVAEAAGGVLGIGRKVSAAEEAALSRLDAAFA